MTIATRQVVTRAEVEDFLYREAALLDDWKLDEWQNLLTDDAAYYVPPNDQPDGDHHATLFLIALVVVLVVASLSMFTVDQRQNAIVFRLGEPVQVIVKPGLYFKAPLLDNVRPFDVRILTLDPDEPERFTPEYTPFPISPSPPARLPMPVSFPGIAHAAGIIFSGTVKSVERRPAPPARPWKPSPSPFMWRIRCAAPPPAKISPSRSGLACGRAGNAIASANAFFCFSIHQASLA